MHLLCRDTKIWWNWQSKKILLWRFDLYQIWRWTFARIYGCTLLELLCGTIFQLWYAPMTPHFGVQHRWLTICWPHLWSSWAKIKQDLRALKALIKNTIRYSSFAEDEKEAIMEAWTMETICVGEDNWPLTYAQQYKVTYNVTYLIKRFSVTDTNSNVLTLITSKTRQKWKKIF